MICIHGELIQQKIACIRLLATYARPPPPGEFGSHTLS